jgi:8-oxo-dGTP pyrophosphatase MutT (NUDIX family)
MIKLKSILLEIIENDAEHFEALRTTGFFGERAAGCIFLAKDTKRILISHRSAYVEQPNMWGSFGGAINNKQETPEKAVEREVKEEAGYNIQSELIPLAVFTAGKFKYYNFLAIVDHEFIPEIATTGFIETQDYKWVTYGDWPTPLHFGLQYLFDQSGDEIQEIITRLSNSS